MAKCDNANDAPFKVCHGVVDSLWVFAFCPISSYMFTCVECFESSFPIRTSFKVIATDNVSLAIAAIVHWAILAVITALLTSHNWKAHNNNNIRKIVFAFKHFILAISHSFIFHSSTMNLEERKK